MKAKKVETVKEVKERDGLFLPVMVGNSWHLYQIYILCLKIYFETMV